MKPTTVNGARYGYAVNASHSERHAASGNGLRAAQTASPIKTIRPRFSNFSNREGGGRLRARAMGEVGAMEADLARALKSHGVLDSMKAQLRSQLLGHLRTGLGGAAGAPHAGRAAGGASLAELAELSILARTLEARGMAHTLAVFLPEAGLSESALLSADEALGAAGVPPAPRAPADAPRSRSVPSPLALALAAASAGAPGARGALQPLPGAENGATAGTCGSLEAALLALDGSHAQRAAALSVEPLGQLEARMAAFVAECERRYGARLSAEIARVRVEERLIASQEAHATLAQRAHALGSAADVVRLEAARDARAALARRGAELDARERELEAVASSHRQRVLAELDGLRARDEDTRAAQQRARDAADAAMGAAAELRRAAEAKLAGAHADIARIEAAAADAVASEKRALRAEYARREAALACAQRDVEEGSSRLRTQREGLADDLAVAALARAGADDLEHDAARRAAHAADDARRLRALEVETTASREAAAAARAQAAALALELGQLRAREGALADALAAERAAAAAAGREHEAAVGALGRLADARADETRRARADGLAQVAAARQQAQEALHAHTDAWQRADAARGRDARLLESALVAAVREGGGGGASGGGRAPAGGAQAAREVWAALVADAAPGQAVEGGVHAGGGRLEALERERLELAARCRRFLNPNDGAPADAAARLAGAATLAAARGEAAAAGAGAAPLRGAAVPPPLDARQQRLLAQWESESAQPSALPRHLALADADGRARADAPREADAAAARRAEADAAVAAAERARADAAERARGQAAAAARAAAADEARAEAAERQRVEALRRIDEAESADESQRRGDARLETVRARVRAHACARLA
jgi:hypothetical protein